MTQTAPNNHLAPTSASSSALRELTPRPFLIGKNALTIGRIPPLGTPRPPLAKRVFDLATATTLLLATAPLMAVIAPLIKLDSPGPIFYTQERVGINRRRNRHRRLDTIPAQGDLGVHDRRRTPAEGRLFQIVKFRTMVADAEKDTGPTWAAPNDPRLTRVGRLLRPARLDELPQLWNVLRGQMSLVGPRPERPHFVNRFVDQIPGYRTRLEALPGITGLAQVENAYDTSEADVRKKLDYDLEYMRRTSLREDLWILLRTMVVMLTGRGAR